MQEYQHPSHYLPHSEFMVLIDQILDQSEKEIRCLVNPENHPEFLEEDGTMPIYVGVELMAQSIAAFSGVQAKKNGEAVQLGFLLGSRNYKTFEDSFEGGQPLLVHSELLFKDPSGLASFSCSIALALSHETKLAQANLNVFQPHHPEAFMAENIK